MKLWEMKHDLVFVKKDSMDKKQYKIVGDKILCRKYGEDDWKIFKFNLFVNKTEFEEYKEPLKTTKFYAYPLCKDDNVRECSLTFMSDKGQPALLNIQDDETALKYPLKVEPHTNRFYVEVTA